MADIIQFPVREGAATRDRFYVLDKNCEPVPATQQEWEAFPREKRIVAETRLDGDIEIRTAFNGMDLHFGEEDPPFLFQSCVIVREDGDDNFYWRSWKEAQGGHDRLVRTYSRGGGQSCQLKIVSADG